MTRVTITLPPRPYDAVIENGLLQQAGEKLREVFDGASVVAGDFGHARGADAACVRGHGSAGAPQVGQEVDDLAHRPPDSPDKSSKCPTASATRNWPRWKNCRSS